MSIIRTMAERWKTGFVPKIVVFCGYAAFFSCLFLIINGLAPNIEMAVSGGRILHIIRPRMVFCFSLLLTFILNPKRIPRNIFIPWAAFCVYLIFELLYFRAKGLDAHLIASAFNSYYLLILMFPFFSSLTGVVHFRKMLAILRVIFVVLAAIGLAQLLLNAPVLPVGSCDGVFTVSSWEFYRGIRMFSLFSAPMGFVLYSVFLLVISLPGPKARSVSCCDHTKLILNILTAAAAAILVYAGYLRSGYVFLFFAITTFLVYYCVYPGRRLFRYLPIAYLAAGILFVAGLSARVPDALLINTAKNIYLTAYGGGKIRAAAVSGTKQPGCDNFKFFNLPDVHKNLTPAAAPISAPVSIPAPPSPLSVREIVHDKLGNSDSFASRLAQWSFCWDMLTSGARTFLFGTGYSQGNTGMLLLFPIDNAYMAVAINTGLIGLCIYFWYWWNVWTVLYNDVVRNRPFALPLAAMFCAAIVACFFDFIFSTVVLYLAIAYFVEQPEDARLNC